MTERHPCTYSSQPDDNRERALRDTRQFLQECTDTDPSNQKIHAFLEGIWNNAFQVGNIILRLQAPIPMRLPCPCCHAIHVDEPPFDQQPHHTHACQECGNVWRPALQPTVGVRFLPGFKNPNGEDKA